MDKRQDMELKFSNNETIRERCYSHKGELVYIITENIRLGEFYLYKRKNDENKKIKTAVSPSEFKEVKKFFEEERKILDEQN